MISTEAAEALLSGLRRREEAAAAARARMAADAKARATAMARRVDRRGRNKALFDAAGNGDTQGVRAAITAGAEVDWHNPNYGRHTPLHAAAANNQLGAAKELIEHGADVNARKGDGSTPLMGASLNGHVAIVEFLLGSGADKELEATGGAWRGKVALDFARKYKKLAVMKLLSPAAAPPLNHNHYFID
jgi:ankyrin repeat protein